MIGVVKGTNPRLANEYVLYSGHQDHDGVALSVNGDSIWNGADDNATVSVALPRRGHSWSIPRRGRSCSCGTARRSVDFLVHDGT